MGIEIERIDAGSLQALDERLIRRDAPLLISNSVDERSRRERWSPSALCSAAGAVTVSVVKSDTETFDFTRDGEPRYSVAHLPFAEALDLITSSRDPGPYYYMRAVALSELGIGAEGLPGASVARGSQKTLYLWLSAAHCVTPLHYDMRSTLLTQMHGTKEVTLFPPSELRRMYPHGIRRETYFYSRVDPEAVDAKLFPDFPSGLRTTFELKPGDALLLPPFWWHRVRSRDLSVSASVLWRLRAEDCLVPAAVDYLRFKYLTKRLEEFFAGEAERAPLCFARLAAEAYGRGLACSATLFCGAAAHLALRVLALTGEASEAGGAAAPVSAQALAEAGVISESERRQAQLWTFLADFAALHGKAPKAAELEGMLAGVSDFAARCLSCDGTPQRARVEA